MKMCIHMFTFLCFLFFAYGNSYFFNFYLLQLLISYVIYF